jgi:SAM-dependent methyltransferase
MKLLPYLILPHHVKMWMLGEAGQQKLDRINREGNEQHYATEDYDATHAVDPVAVRAAETRGPYGRVLEIGAGSGYYTELIADRADRVIALEPVAGLRKALLARCPTVQASACEAINLESVCGPQSVDTVVMFHALHHLHRRPEVFAAIGRVLCPNGRVILVEPMHTLKRMARLTVKWCQTYRHEPDPERYWGTHDFVTRAELRALCRVAGLKPVFTIQRPVIVMEARRRLAAPVPVRLKPQ